MKSNLPTLALTLLAAGALALAAPASGQILFDAQLSGTAETPPIFSEHSGSCTGVLTGFGGPDPSFHIACDHNVDDASMAHIHVGAPGVPGDVVFPFADPDDIDATWDLSVDEAIRLLAGGYYVNVHTPAHPGGEIRGQLFARQGASSEEVVRFELSGDQEVPPVETDASGVCVAVVEQTVSGVHAEGTMDLYCTHDVDDPTEAHIHLGEAGVDGGVVVPLGDPASPLVVEGIDLDSTLIAALRDGELYVNIHDAANPGGVIRGQITGCFGSPTTLCLVNGRYEVSVEWATDQGGGGFGDGFAVPETDNSGMFWFFEPSNLELLIKVLEGCPVNGHTWVFFSGTTNVAVLVEVVDTMTGDIATYTTPDETVLPARLDTTAFDNCAVP